MKKLWLLALLCFNPQFLLADEPPQLRVFILAGQSNMEGKGAIKHLEKLLNSKAGGDFEYLKDGAGWVKRDDVSIQYLERKGALTVGYGTPTNRIGPELGFGHVVGNKFNEHVLLIKTAWGGRSLAVDFRPPSSGNGTYQMRDRQTKEMVPVPDEMYGTAYREMLQEVRKTLSNIEEYIPEGAAKNGYELSGFVWFQGFNDIINNEYTAEYEENLQNLIRDVRRDLKVPELPFIIGELGQQGMKPEKRYAEKHFRFRRIQSSVAQQPEFKRFTTFVKTSPYVIGDADSYDGGYHYYGRADTFLAIGNAFGEAVLLLCRDTPLDHSQLFLKNAETGSVSKE